MKKPIQAMLHVKPAIEDAIVRIPERKMRPMHAQGEQVPMTNYWLRRLAHGDVVAIDDDVEAESAAPVADPPKG